MENEDNIIKEETTGEQPLNRHDILENEKRNRAEHLQPYQYKKGQSGNPSGRAKGISLKEYVKMKFSTMTDDEKEEFMNGLSKDTIWEMGEGKPQQDTKIDGSLEVKMTEIQKIRDDTQTLLNDKDTTISKEPI